MAIHEVIMRCPENSNLIIMSDSMSNMWAFRKGLSDRGETQALISSAISKALSKRVAFVIRFVNTQNNKADYPSRYQVKNAPWPNMFVEGEHKLSRDEYLDWLDAEYDHPLGSVEGNIFNLL